jgi:Mg2+ and Co2+ transporter CorA
LAEEKASEIQSERKLEVEDIKRHLELLDQRLDNIDSIVSAVAERVMNQPITLNITCPGCGKNIEVNLIGTGKPTV